MEFHGPDCNTMMRRFPLQSSAIDETSVADDRSQKHEIIEWSDSSLFLTVSATVELDLVG